MIVLICCYLLINVINQSLQEYDWHSNFTQDSVVKTSAVVLGPYPPKFHDNRTTIRIGYLATDQNVRPAVKGLARTVSGAVTLAVLKINQDPNLLPGYRLDFLYSDDRGDSLIGTNRICEQWKRGALAFFGPEDSCDTEARLAAAWNLPLLSFKCSDHRLSNKLLYPTFARTIPPDTQITKSVIALLEYFGWKKFAIVAGKSEPWSLMSRKLSKLAEERNMTINAFSEFESPYLQHAVRNPFEEIVENTYIDTRIYVFIGNHNGMVEFMNDMQKRGLTESQKYAVLYPQLDIFDEADPGKYFRFEHDLPKKKRIEKAAENLLIILHSPPSSPEYKRTFSRKVNEYNQKEPFNFTKPNLSELNPFLPADMLSQPVGVYAAYLYDAIFLYAKAVTELLEKNSTSILDGRKIFQMLKDRVYQSVQGFDVYVDENGDAEGNYTVLGRTKFHYSLPFYNITGDYSMKPIGRFSLDKESGKAKLLFTPKDEIVLMEIADEPSCGYRGQRCLVAPSYTKVIVLSVLGTLFLITCITGLVTYRNWRYEQEIDGLLWKISLSDIGGLKGDTTSEWSGNSVESLDFRSQRLTQTVMKGTYKGQVVALKNFCRPSMDIGRLLKKEMKTMRTLRHDNLNSFIGAHVDDEHIIVVTEYCSKGSLQDVLVNENVKLDRMFIASLIMDLIRAMIFIHGSELNSHGNLKSSNCLVNSRWLLQVSDYGLDEIRRENYKMQDESYRYKQLFWTPPEHLRNKPPPRRGTQKGDVFAFAIILYEIFGKTTPYGGSDLRPKEIIDKVAAKSNESYRPDLSELKDCEEYIKTTISNCWAEEPESRPDFQTIKGNLNNLCGGRRKNIFSNMLQMMETYQSNLERLVEERTEQLLDEKRKTEALLYRMLPISVAKQLIAKKPVVPESFSCVTIYFSDICGFTPLCASSTPLQVVNLLNDLYTLFDNIINNYYVYKVETIGDAYMVVSGLPEKIKDDHAGEIASMSLHLLSAIKTFKIPHRPEQLMLRIGIHSGSVVTGVVGQTMPRYCLFGDTVNTASRMESQGEALKIHVSADCKNVLEKLGGYNLIERGHVTLKGKGCVKTYWLLSEDQTVRADRLKRTTLLQKIQTDATNRHSVLEIMTSTDLRRTISSQSIRRVPNGNTLHSETDKLLEEESKI